MNREILQQGFSCLEAVGLMRLAVCHMLHAGLNSLCHEQRFFIGGIPLVEHFPHSAAVPVEAHGEAGPSLGFREVDRPTAEPALTLWTGPAFCVASWGR